MRTAISKSIFAGGLLVALLGMVRDAAAQARTLAQALAESRPPSPCKHSGRSDRCNGQVTRDLADTAIDNREAIAKWLVDSVEFRTGYATPWPWGRDGNRTFYINHTLDSDRYFVPDIATAPATERGMVVARISADMDRRKGPDAMYGVGHITGRNFRSEFYIVVDAYDADERDFERGGYKVGRWFVLGVEDVRDGNNRRRTVASRVGKTGTFRLCAHPHDEQTRRYGAGFKPCVLASKLGQVLSANEGLRQALGSNSIFHAVAEVATTLQAESRPRGFETLALPSERSDLTDARRTAYVRPALDAFLKAKNVSLQTADATALVAILVASLDAPAWMPCGVGCCAADEGR